MSFRRIYGVVLYPGNLVHRIRELELEYNIVEAVVKCGRIDDAGYSGACHHVLLETRGHGDLLQLPEVCGG